MSNITKTWDMKASLIIETYPVAVDVGQHTVAVEINTGDKQSTFSGDTSFSPYGPSSFEDIDCTVSISKTALDFDKKTTVFVSRGRDANVSFHVGGRPQRGYAVLEQNTKYFINYKWGTGEARITYSRPWF